MFITDIKKDFYEKITSKQVLLLVHCDIDAICACRILQYLFQTDSVMYTLTPVSGWKDVETAFNESAHLVDAVVMLNCGATVDIVDELKLPDKLLLFVADSHRPLHVCNVYREEQVMLLMKADPEDDIPQFDTIFRDESDDEDEEERGNLEEVLTKRRERRLWEDQRNKILFDYTQFTYYGSSTAMCMVRLSEKLSKDTNELLWLGIVGMTEQYISGHVDAQRYILDCGQAQQLVSKLTNKDDTIDAPKISFITDLQLILYRHWSLLESIKHTPYTSCKFVLWTLKGERRCHEMLAELGLPLVQCRQKFQAMDVPLRKEVKPLMESKASKYQLKDLVYGTFQIRWGTKHQLTASDYLFAASALLETPNREKSQSDKFMDALDSLSRFRVCELEDGIELCKKQLNACYNQVQSLLHTHQILCVGPFLYAAVSEGGVDTGVFGHPHCINLLARWLLRAYASMSKSRRPKSLPLVLSAPYVQEPGVCIIIGIPPIADDSAKNLFGKAFEQACDRTGANLDQDYIDNSVIRLKAEDRSKFLDALIALLS